MPGMLIVVCYLLGHQHKLHNLHRLLLQIHLHLCEVMSHHILLQYHELRMRGWTKQ